MTQNPANTSENLHTEPETESGQGQERSEKAKQAREIGGPKGLEPTRYGDWERNGRCSDF